MDSQKRLAHFDSGSTHIYIWRTISGNSSFPENKQNIQKYQSDCNVKAEPKSSTKRYFNKEISLYKVFTYTKLEKIFIALKKKKKIGLCWWKKNKRSCGASGETCFFSLAKLRSTEIVFHGNRCQFLKSIRKNESYSVQPQFIFQPLF